MKFSFSPQPNCAGPEGTVGPITVTDGADCLRLIHIVERHPLRVRLRGLAMDGLPVEASDRRGRKVLRAIQGTETIKAIEPAQRWPLGDSPRP